MLEVYENNKYCITYCNNNTYDISLLKNNENMLLVSGGIDSQSVYLYLKKNNIKFKTIFCNYSFNKYDRDFAKKLNYDYELSLDLDNFFFKRKEHLTYYDLYKCTSPQLAVHLHIIDYVRENFPKMNILMPGTPPQLMLTRNQSLVSTLPDYIQLSYYRYKVKNNLSNFYPYFWFEFYEPKKILSFEFQYNLNIRDYQKKIMIYNELGLNVIPQETKKTGFEEYKEYLESKNILFDRKLREPIDKNKKTFVVFEKSMITNKSKICKEISTN